MLEVAPNVFLLDGFPRFGINVYLLGDVLVDAGTRLDKNRILRQVKDRPVSVHVLTHAHPDHQGSSKAVCEALEVELWCGEGDKAAMETGDYSKTTPKGRGSRFPNNLMNGPPYPVSRALKEGDSVGEFTVIETPGHTTGHLSYWRESDGVLIVGDTVFGMNIVTFRQGLHEPPTLFTLDPEQNRQSIRKLAKLEPKVLCFGHGKPVDGETFGSFLSSKRDRF